MAEFIEQSELDVETPEAQELPQDPNAMSSQEELIASLEGNPEPAAPELPDKYNGKSVEDLARMHQEAEKLIGKHSSEVGELRKVVDQYIVQQLDTNKQEREPEPEPVDFFEDPDTAVNRAIENHPSVQQANQQAQQYQKQTAMAQLQQKHPDMKEVLGDPQFAEWVKGSKVRTQLFQQADAGYDADVADELLSLYKERQGVAQQTAQVETQARKQQVKAAATGAQGAGAGGGGKRIYRRADIIKLMKTDPERYEALSPELMQAYAEGRVR